MPSLFEKNLTLVANQQSLVDAAKATSIKEFVAGNRCELCNQPIVKGVRVAFPTGEQLTIGYNCHDTIEVIRRTGGYLSRKEVRNMTSRREKWAREQGQILHTIVIRLREKSNQLVAKEQVAFDFLEKYGFPFSTKEGDMLLASYHRLYPNYLDSKIYTEEEIEWLRATSPRPDEPVHPRLESLKYQRR